MNTVFQVFTVINYSVMSIEDKSSWVSLLESQVSFSLCKDPLTFSRTFLWPQPPCHLSVSLQRTLPLSTDTLTSSMLNKQKPSAHPARLTSCHPSAPFIHPVALILVTSPQSLSPPSGAMAAFSGTLGLCLSVVAASSRPDAASSPPSRSPPLTHLLLALLPRMAGGFLRVGSLSFSGESSSLPCVLVTCWRLQTYLSRPSLPSGSQSSLPTSYFPWMPVGISNRTLQKTPSLQIPPPTPPWPSASQ